MLRAVEKVRQRVRRVAAALEAAGVPYAVTGGNAVAAWVARVDEAAVRNTRDVDLLLRREDLERATQALERVGFVYEAFQGVVMFLDGPEATPRDTVHVIFANEKVRPEYIEPAADVEASVPAADYRVVSLEALVRMKLTSFRLKDQVHLQDMIEVGLIDETWLGRLPHALAKRLKQVLDNPSG